MKLQLQKDLLDVHKHFLKRSRESVGKEYEGFFVLMLRCSEAFVKPLTKDDPQYWYGMTAKEIEDLTADDVTKIYQALMTYYAVALDGERLPGTYKERIHLTIKVCGTVEFAQRISDYIPEDLDAQRRIIVQTSLMADTVSDILGVRNADQEQISETLFYSATQVIGLQAIRASQRRCFVASSAFDSAFHPTVDSLRKYRDEILAQGSIGRAFIGIYERAGPMLAKILDSVPIAKPAIRGLLTFCAATIDDRIP